ncbi:lipopolysaccharide biosynthesis protein [Lewinella sp. W8]|uniref:lipopolysaccharide biosynthesis protein n=1 Tax=Lewinella sp. W8 TaxID=2528208 RepID=UPI0010677960|nr:polysaccharide biosynthesis C-terminal domain-containing protein [Lewinella sp. W8]MTB49543.1 hypothetical protein [Lewinella sp. W8]
MSSRSSLLIRAGQIVQALRQGALILIALALPRLGLGLTEIGHWESLLFVGYILGFGWLTGLLQAYLVRIRLTRPEAARKFSRLALGTIFVVSLLLLGVAAGAHQWFFDLLRLGETPPGWWWYFLFLLTQWPGLFFEQVLVVEDRPRGLLVFGTLSALGMIMAILGPLLAGDSLEGALYWLAVCGVVKGILILGWTLWDYVLDKQNKQRAITVKRHGKLTGAMTGGQDRWRELLTAWWSAAWPLMIYASLGAMVTAFDPWFVNYWYEGEEDTFALFRYGARELPLLAAVTNGMITVVLPQLTESPTVGLQLLRNSSRRLFHWIFPGTILLLATTGYWWEPLFTATFAESEPLFRAYLFVIVSRLLFPVPVLTALGHTRMLMVFGGLELLLNVALSFLLAPAYGLLGIIWATVLAYFLDKLLLMYYLYRRTGIRPGHYLDLRWYVGYVAVLMLVYLFF